MTEWLKVHGWNPCVGQLTGGSNPPLSATFIIEKGEGRVPETGARELRQVREEATVATFPGLWVARLSPFPMISVTLWLCAATSPVLP